MKPSALRGTAPGVDAAAPLVRAAVAPVEEDAESGYALLFVLMMAACVAIMLYMELPRVAFEAQREKEQLLIDRGEQYERGIQLYFRKFNQYPATLDALDNTQNIRFLRHHYADPMTGKNEWRLIHVGPGGAFIDSVLNKGKSVAPAPAEKSSLVAEIPLIATGGNDPNTTVNLATRRRPSDTPGGSGPLDPNAPPPPFDPNSNNGVIGGVPGQNLPGQGIPGQNLPGQIPGQTAQNLSQQGIPAQQNPYAQTSNMPGQPGAPPTTAANMINQMLTSPRPGGLNGNPGLAAQQPVDPSAPQAISSLTSPAASNTGTPITGTIGQSISGGIAGVASKAEGEGIKVYDDRSKYSEWEFIYDLSKDLTKTGGGQTLPQAGQTQQQNGIGSQSPFNSSSPQSAFGTQQQTAAPVPPPPPPPQQ